MDKKQSRQRRARKSRANIREHLANRLCVHRTPRHTYAQVISADGAKVLASASTVEKDFRGKGAHGGNVAAAAEIGMPAKRVSSSVIQK